MKKLTEIEWRLLQNSSINLYKDETIFEEDCKSLKKVGYKVSQVNCDSVLTFTTDITNALDWKNQFGYSPWNGNLDALNDAMRDTTLGHKGKFALACKNFHKLVKADKNMAIVFLDLLEYNSRNHLLENCLFIGLIQTRDGHFNPKNLGSRSAQWNSKEWLNKNRGI
jgi:hypothetical protein